MIFVFTLCHGQTQVRRGFNIHSNFLVQNLSALSFTSKRRVYDFLASSNLNPHDFVTDDELKKLYDC